eukprot:TRINITY_DN23615_c0_g1_i1.p1 TRINITY_DN23615_c0_g1~~TRINITY_DN23615_c0_g1_i1.p1  ORF type:complete len:1429 (+),score=252.04 TRINITY_DN23615_c0_g1_i1:62-4348(+)
MGDWTPPPFAQTAAAAPVPAIDRVEAIESLKRVWNVLLDKQQISTTNDQNRRNSIDDLNNCAQAVAGDGFIRHSAPEVRLWAAKCLAQVLKLFAPNPPFDKCRLRAVLQLFIEQLATVSEPTGYAYKHAFALLEMLAETRGFLLLFDCDDSVALLSSLVDVCVSAGRSATVEPGRLSEAAQHAQQHLEGLLMQLLRDILCEADLKELPSTILATLVEELMQRKQVSSAAGLVRRLFGSLARGSIALPINDFLNANIYSELHVGYEIQKTDGDKKDDVPARADSQERLEGLFRAVLELYCIDPALVARVLPNLHMDFQSGDPNRRRAVTALVGRMLAHTCQESGSSSSSQPSLASTHPSIVDLHRERLADADDTVRLTALESTAAILQTASSVVHAQHTEPSKSLLVAAEALAQKLAERSLDPNDQIRGRAVDIAVSVGSHSTAGLALMLPVLPGVCKRMLDKKPRVREVCVEAAAHLYAKHALPAWLEGNYQQAQALSWIPQMFCEAYSVFSSGQCGQVALLEESIEQNILGCGAGLEDQERALALLGFHWSACQGEEVAQRGLALLLSKKRDAHAALRRYLHLRIAKSAPLLARSSAALAGAIVPSDRGAQVAADALQKLWASDQDSGEALLDGLAKFSPALEEKVPRPEVVLMHLRTLDGVRDKSLWSQLDHLTNPYISDSSQELASHLLELDERLRFHKLGELTSLVRRALLSTWLLPCGVFVLLDLWRDAGQCANGSGGALEQFEAARHAVANLPKYIPGPFLSHAGAIVRRLCASSTEDAYAALRSLSSLGKRVLVLQAHCFDLPASFIDSSDLEGALVEAVAVASKDVTTRASASRKAVKVLGLLPATPVKARVAQALLSWAEEQILRCKPTVDAADSETREPVEEDELCLAAALHLASAIMAQPACRLEPFQKPDSKAWLENARHILCSGFQASSDVRCAAAELVAVTGSQSQIYELLLDPTHNTDLLPLEASESRPSQDCGVAADIFRPWLDPLPAHAACSVIRVLRHGSVPLSTLLVTGISSRFCACLAPGRPTYEAELLLQALQSLQRPPPTAYTRLADRLRLCTTLPSIFALALLKRHRDSAQRMLQASLQKAVRQSSAKQEQLLDFSIACFIHFISRLDVFLQEISLVASAFPESSKVAEFFIEAMLGCDLHQSAELAGVALRVCDRVRYFVDREHPKSDAVHKAAFVLRHVVEKRCPQMGIQSSALLQGSKEGSMPAELFAIYSEAVDDTAKMHEALPASGSCQESAAAPSSADLLALADADIMSSPCRSHVVQRKEAVSPSMDNEPPSPVSTILATPQRGRSLLKHSIMSPPPVPMARPVPQSSVGPSLTGAVVRAALSARAAEKEAKIKRNKASLSSSPVPGSKPASKGSASPELAGTVVFAGLGGRASERQARVKRSKPVLVNQEAKRPRMS